MRSILNFVLLSTLFAFNACSPPLDKTSDNSETMTTQDSISPLLYIGTYTRKEGHVDGKAEGIYIMEMNTETGELTGLDTITNGINPSYLTVHPNGKYLYAVNELADGTDAYVGTVSAYLLDENGRFDKALNVVNAQGDAPCHVSVDATGKYVLVASYMGTIAAFPIQADGSLGEASSIVKHELANPPGGRQDGAHAHMIVSAIDDKSVFVTDLGKDQVIHYQLINGELNEVAVTEVTKGAGPRHMAFHPTQEHLYVLGELNRSVEVFKYTRAEKPFDRMQIVSTFDRPITTGGVFCSAIRIHPNGKFLYVGNRGISGNTDQTIAMYQIDEKTGRLTFLGLQDTDGLVPRDFNISPDGNLLLVGHQDSGTIEAFKIDKATGKLTATGVVNKVATPVCLEFI
ncbi:MAG: 6-phosphogluconolactonase [Saprospiraceae bacterium]|jgi:6-phosphogluconolactonase